MKRPNNVSRALSRKGIVGKENRQTMKGKINKSLSHEPIAVDK